MSFLSMSITGLQYDGSDERVLLARFTGGDGNNLNAVVGRPDTLHRLVLHTEVLDPETGERVWPSDSDRWMRLLATVLPKHMAVELVEHHDNERVVLAAGLGACRVHEPATSWYSPDPAPSSRVS